MAIGLDDLHKKANRMPVNPLELPEDAQLTPEELEQEKKIRRPWESFERQRDLIEAIVDRPTKEKRIYKTTHSESALAPWAPAHKNKNSKLSKRIGDRAQQLFDSGPELKN